VIASARSRSRVVHPSGIGQVRASAQILPVARTCPLCRSLEAKALGKAEHSAYSVAWLVEKIHARRRNCTSVAQSLPSKSSTNFAALFDSDLL